MMGKVYTLICHKGGCGKTATATILSELLAMSSYKILLIDNDPQRNASTVLLGEDTETGNDLSRLFCEVISEQEIMTYIYDTQFKGISLLPASKTLSEVRYTLYEALKTRPDALYCFRNNIDLIRDRYDYIIIDTPPLIDRIMPAAVVIASDWLLIPTNSDSSGLDGIEDAFSLLKYTRELYGNTRTQIAGIFITLASLSSSRDKEALLEYREALGNTFIPVLIRRDEKVKKARDLNVPLLSICHNSAIIMDYCELLLRLNLIDRQHLDTLYEALKKRISRKIKETKHG